MGSFRFLFTLFVLMGGAISAHALQISRIGNHKDLRTKTSFQVCMAGGGDDGAWSEGWSRMLNHSGGGDVVILRNDGSLGEYNTWLFEDSEGHGFRKVNSVTTLSIESFRDANDPLVVKTLRQAELIFFSGGYQHLYIDYLKGSKAEAEIKRALRVRKVPIGGTSAGMAVLGGIVYTGRFSPPHSRYTLVTSEDALRDPQGSFLDLDRRFLVPPFMKNVITETHMNGRSREGRLLGFINKALSSQQTAKQQKKIKGIGADEGTAFCYNERGRGFVYGEGEVAFVSPAPRSANGDSLRAAQVYRIHGQSSEASFDLKKWRGKGGRSTLWSANLSVPEHPTLEETDL